MSNKTEGTLFFDPESGRYDIRFGMDSFYGGTVGTYSTDVGGVNGSRERKSV